MIKKTNLCAVAAAVSALAAGAASAQNVTLFGRIDAGVQYSSKVAGPDGDDIGHRTEVNNGGILPSIWGLKGSEDLGGGLKAVFNLEADFDSGTGGHRGLGNISQPVFSRQANVGLSSDWGTLLIGRQYSPALLQELGTDPRGYKESFSMLLPYAANQLPPGNDLSGQNNGGAIFTSNLVSYTGKFGPFSVGAGFGLGEGNAGQGDGRTYVLGGSYTGPFVVSATYQKVEGAPDAQTERFGLGFALPWDIFTFKVLWSHAEGEDFGTVDPDAEDFETDVIGVGADLKWNPSNTATIAFYYGEDKDEDEDKTKSLVLSNDYAISKRTTLYAQYVFVDKDQDATARTGIDLGLTPQDEKSHILGIGVKHDF
jgi:predicted porin